MDESAEQIAPSDRCGLMGSLRAGEVWLGSRTQLRVSGAAFGVAPHEPSEGIGVEAARLRGRNPISLPDAYCLATAKHAGGSVASFDSKVIRAAAAERIAHVAGKR